MVHNDTVFLYTGHDVASLHDVKIEIHTVKIDRAQFLE